jgi:L-lactate dehydrogenase (cytochrome)
MKIVLKGVNTKEDAVQALEAGCDGVLLSNHGGRQLDFARSGIEVLPETMAALRAHKNYDAARFEVFVDGGIRRGTDIYKALALGAKAVGVGRPALYAMSAFGAEGVVKMIQILKNELEMTMRLMGTPKLSDIQVGSVITDHLHTHIAPVPSDMLQHQTYVPAITQAQRNRFSRAEAAAPHAAAPAPAVEASALVTFVAQVARGLASSVFTLDARAQLHRSSFVLMLYFVVVRGRSRERLAWG